MKPERLVQPALRFQGGGNGLGAWVLDALLRAMPFEPLALSALPTETAWTAV